MFPPEAPKGYIPELDSLRAIAVILVVAVHLHTTNSLRGRFGVVVFFVLSGYLITSITLREEAIKGAVSIGAFYIRRSFRIFPLYYLVLAVYCVLILGFHIEPEKRSQLLHLMPCYLFYFQEVPHILGGANHPFYQSWSLGIEEKFYLIWPFICFFLLRTLRSKRIATAIALIVVTTFGGPWLSNYTAILVGCLLALVLQYDWARAASAKGSKVGVWVALAIVVLVHMIAPPYLRTTYEDLPYSIAVSFFLAFLLFGRSPLRSLLRFRPLAAMGKISYGVYLVHILCINVVEKRIHTFIGSYLCSITLSVAVAAVLYFTIEKPLIRLGKHLGSAWSKPIGLSPAVLKVRPAPLNAQVV